MARPWQYRRFQAFGFGMVKMQAATAIKMLLPKPYGKEQVILWK